MLLSINWQAAQAEHRGRTTDPTGYWILLCNWLSVHTRTTVQLKQQHHQKCDCNQQVSESTVSSWSKLAPQHTLAGSNRLVGWGLMAASAQEATASNIWCIGSTAWDECQHSVLNNNWQNQLLKTDDRNFLKTDSNSNETCFNHSVNMLTPYYQYLVSRCINKDQNSNVCIIRNKTKSSAMADRPHKAWYFFD